ncbi:MAG: GlsB/YeaQ/YmgE family stress response membrane protein [Erysipelotrichaceae bacterium]|nr:GlsB/YeaQ/YmgE family stress response membrane protein [Erysipelotrichaceae bacterium]
MDLIISLITSGLIGYVASIVMKASGPWYVYVLIGIVGGLVGALAFGLLGFAANGTLGYLISSTVGSCIVIWLYRMIKK